MHLGPQLGLRAVEERDVRKAKLGKGLLIATGVISVALGVLGIVVPLLPTTPFLLLAAACFVRSSPRLYNWLIHHKWFGDYIRFYREHRAIPLQDKIVTLVILWSVISFTALRVVTAWWLRGLLAAIAVGVTLHILHLKTLTREMIEQSKATTDAHAVEGGDI